MHRREIEAFELRKRYSRGARPIGKWRGPWGLTGRCGR
jgi:hypothetical protein